MILQDKVALVTGGTTGILRQPYCQGFYKMVGNAHPTN